ncbi:AcrR family transcriptional regulator [Nocardia transvalensis]|uniref:AcrR family transcriptional regulator n=1 Tax=Nocardia transvalensis TaxID=37333 RepID=A0A7W9PJ63_9NOCA|nr:TetR family transcriptional regulator [Nocardia transvalensis]MBB5917075.1 AcrR family transcriptional regulator [Nocardia transvalensis]
MADELGLRERKKLDTRRALSDATLELAFERGLDNVVREDIAARAGVSVRTFSNYFANKYEAMGYRQVERIQRSIDLLRARPASEPMWTAVTAAVLEPFESEGLPGYRPTREQLAEIRKLVQAPEVQGALNRWTYNDITSAIAERSGTDPRRDLYPRLVAGAVVAAFQATTEIYIHADPPIGITELLRQALAAFADGLPEPTR